MPSDRTVQPFGFAMAAPTLNQVMEVFREVLDLGDRDPREAVPGEVWSWDSLAHVLLISALESEFGVSIDTGTSLEVASFQHAVDALEATGVVFSSSEDG